MLGEMMLSRSQTLIMSRTLEEHIFKMVLLFKRIPSRAELNDMHLDLPTFDRNENKDKMTYTEYLHQELQFAMRPYIPEGCDLDLWYVDVPFRYHADDVDAMDLLCQCLQYSPLKRIKAAEALRHPFFQEDEGI